MKQHAHNHRRGITTVEFALVASLFFMFVTAAIEFARVNMVNGTVANAAYEGARRAIIPGVSAEEAKDAAMEVVAASFISSSEVTLNPATLTPDTTEVTVTVSVDMDSNGWLILPRFTEGLQLSKSCTLEREAYVQEIDSQSPPPPGGHHH